MPSRTLDLGQVESIVQDYYLPVIRDNYFLSNAAFYRLRDRARFYEGGRAIFQPLSFAPEGGGGQWWTGVDKMDTRVRNPITGATFYRKNFTVPVVVTRDESDSVGGPTAIVQLADAKMQIARPTAVDGVGTAIFNNGTDPKQIGGLGLMVSASGTYGGISASTNTWWAAQADATAYTTGATGNFAGARGFGPVGKMWVRIGRISGKRPTMILSNWGAYQDYHDSLAGVGLYAGTAAGTANAGIQAGGQRYMQMDSELARAGFENVMYKNAPWVVDERAPHDASNVEAVYMLHEPAVNLVVHSARNMSFDPFRQPPDQRIQIGYIDWAGELVCSERRAQGVISAVTTTATS